MRADQWSPRLQPRSPVAPVSGGRSCHGRFQRRQRRASLGAAVVPGPPDPRSEAVKTPAPSALARLDGRRARNLAGAGENLARGRPQRAVHAVRWHPDTPVARSKRRLWDLNTPRGHEQCRLPALPACLLRAALRCTPRPTLIPYCARHQPARSSGVARSAARRSSRRCRCTIRSFSAIGSMAANCSRSRCLTASGTCSQASTR